MKTKFIPKTQTSFRLPMAKTRVNGTMHFYTKAFKLSDGSKMSSYHYEETDEGYHSTYEERINRGGILFREVGSESRDCDGRYSNFREQVLQSGKWVEVKYNQRDYTAESMGY